ncbi:unnamed protein product [Didymodactylos carnosus]|uniref:Tetratricopeptide repeat protein n=1 Tax=Didymodactylos carnosus TaxID=1234261 RepID=A0A8S2EZE6_9BILA|nr:unnamed protein product [Didymodactylos carnosus]CAF4148257.1 unnamed protein product [Didymodactylos carnosus]
MAETFLTIWLDTQNHDTDTKSPVTQTLLQLHNVVIYVQLFHDADECIDYITDIKKDDRKTFFVISCDTQFGNEIKSTLLQLAEELPQIHSVYTMGSNEKESDAFSYSKSHGIYTDVQSLCNQMFRTVTIERHRQRRLVSDDFTIKTLDRVPIIAETTITTTTTQLASVSTSIRRQEAQFMYAQFLRDILVEMESSEEEMVTFCRQKYIDNAAQLKFIDEFQEYYDSCNAIFWYTRDTFLYGLLNTALREQDVDTLYSLRYFIKDLHLQLKGVYVSQQSAATTTEQATTTVYRGQLMTNDEFEQKIQQNIGGFFSVSTFLSTTLDRKLANLFAGDGSRTDEVQSVLFQIDIDKTVNKFPYADISTESAFGDDEGEILFTMGAVFRIESIEKMRDDDDNVWNVQLKLTDEEDELLQKLTEHMKDDFIDLHPVAKYAVLMREMGYYTKAEKFFFLALEESSLSENYVFAASLYNALGGNYKRMGQIDKALEYYEKSIAAQLQHLPENDPQVAATSHDLAIIYKDQGDFERALVTYNKTLEICLKEPIPNQSAIATVYNSIANVYTSQRRYSEALEIYAKALDIQFKVLPHTHPSLAILFVNISGLHNERGDNDKAIRYLNIALAIFQNSLPPSHPQIAATYRNLSKVLYDQGKLSEALIYMSKSFSIDSNNLPAGHPDVIKTREYIIEMAEELRNQQLNTTANKSPHLQETK